MHYSYPDFWTTKLHPIVLMNVEVILQTAYIMVKQKKNKQISPPSFTLKMNDTQLFTTPKFEEIQNLIINNTTYTSVKLQLTVFL